MRPLALPLLPLLLPLLSTPPASASAAQELVSLLISNPPDHNSPEYLNCLNTACADYLNVTSICQGRSSDGNYTVDPVVARRNYLRCVCPEKAYLGGGLQKCENCTSKLGEPSAVEEKKKECEDFYNSTSDSGDGPDTVGKGSGAAAVGAGLTVGIIGVVAAVLGML